MLCCSKKHHYMVRDINKEYPTCTQNARCWHLLKLIIYIDFMTVRTLNFVKCFRCKHNIFSLIDLFLDTVTHWFILEFGLYENVLF